MVPALLLDQPVHAVQSRAAVVADDAAAAIRVRQAGDDVGLAGGQDVGGVGVEDALVVRLAVLREGLVHLGRHRVAVHRQRGLDHTQAAVGHDRPLQRRVGLQTHDELAVLVDVPGVVGRDGRGNQGDVQDALLALLGEQLAQPVPDLRRALGGAGEEGRVPVVGRVVLLDEVPDRDAVPPDQPLEPAPGVEPARRAARGGGLLDVRGCHRKPLSLSGQGRRWRASRSGGVRPADGTSVPRRSTAGQRATEGVLRRGVFADIYCPSSPASRCSSSMTATAKRATNPADLETSSPGTCSPIH